MKIDLKTDTASLNLMTRDTSFIFRLTEQMKRGQPGPVDAIDAKSRYVVVGEILSA